MYKCLCDTRGRGFPFSIFRKRLSFTVHTNKYGCQGVVAKQQHEKIYSECKDSEGSADKCLAHPARSDSNADGDDNIDCSRGGF